MRIGNEKVYIGLQLNNEFAVLSVYVPKNGEPQTLTQIVGNDNYMIPVRLAKKPHINQWIFGEEANKLAKIGSATLVKDIYKCSLAGEDIDVDGESFEAIELLAIFIRRVISMLGVSVSQLNIDRFVFCVDSVESSVVSLLRDVMLRLSVDPKRLMTIDKKEAFYYFALSQNSNLYTHDVVMYDISGDTITHRLLSRNLKTKPQMIDLKQGEDNIIGDDKDAQFLSIAEKVMSGRLITSVYLVGSEFENDWINMSLKYLLRGRKVFLGNNLYSKGAAVAGAVKNKAIDWQFVYIGDNELKLNLYIKVLDDNEMKFYTLLSAGDSWLEAKGECEIILDETKEIEVWIQQPDSREAHVELLGLNNLPDRPRRTTRLRINANATSDTKARIVIKDLGFGEIAPASGLSWEHTIHMK